MNTGVWIAFVVLALLGVPVLGLMFGKLILPLIVFGALAVLGIALVSVVVNEEDRKKKNWLP